uniref:mitogen-activated protein kinase n=1 Tax=Varanus komodoensis TaxID=61221 RepID=A0A8D2LP77_VARKO
GTGPIAKGWGEWFDPSLGQGMQKAEGHMWSGGPGVLSAPGSSTSLCTKRSAPAFLRSGRHRTMVTIESDSDFYDVFEILGKGTFGEVVKSWKRSTGEMVAIKILKNDSYRSRIIKNELKLLQTMSEVDTEAAHIVQFHEFFHDELKFYLVFELLEQNLFDFQKEHNFSPLAVRHIRTVTTQVLRALAKLKELSIIHADLKPENIMLVDQVRFPFRVKVIDFGSASIFSEVRYVKEPYIQSRFYRAPEILLGLPFCEKVDVWSLGCVMAELHLGWPLYPGNNEYDQIRYICETQGMPRPTLLNASMERRKYMLKSLDQMETVNIHKMIYPDTEAVAEYFDLRSMVELITRMLTWDSHERITPSAALKHPFISTQPLKQNYHLTQYYECCLRSLRESLPSRGTSRCQRPACRRAVLSPFPCPPPPGNVGCQMPPQSQDTPCP